MEEMDKWRRIAAEKRETEKKELLAMSEIEAKAISTATWYQRMRYMREDYAAEYLAERNRNNVAPIATRAKGNFVGNVVLFKEN